MEQKVYTKGGIPVYIYDNKDSHSFFLSLFVKAGSIYESDTEAGITHFFEHVAIRNVNCNMGGTLYNTLDKYGLEFNASTYSEMVQFYISGAPKNFALAADIFSRLLSPISLPKSEIDRERDRIRAEIREADEKTSLAGFTSALVWQGTPLSRSITGTPKSVGAITGKRLEEYRRRIFSPDNLFVYITGKITDADISTLCRLLDSYPLNEGEKHCNLAPVPQKFGKRDAEVAIKNADFTKVRFTFDIDMSEVASEEIDLLYDILLGGYSSGFFIELSERRGLCYDLTGQTERYKNIGTLSFSYELKEGRLYEALECTVSELSRLKSAPLSPDRLMKAGYTDNADMLLDDVRELNFTMGYDNHVLGLGYRDINARREKYSAVTPERIMCAARKIFTRDNLTLTLKGNRKRIDTEKIRGILKEL